MPRRHYYKVHLELRSHAEKSFTRERRKKVVFLEAGTWNESSKVYRFIENVESKKANKKKVKSCEGKDLRNICNVGLRFTISM